jgi:hypothetical protein
MPKAVVALFDSRKDAERAAEGLMDGGFAPGEVEIRSSQSVASRESETMSWWEWLFGESEDRNYYTEGMARGGAVLTVMTSDDRAHRARMVLEAHGGDVEPPRPTGTVTTADSEKSAAAAGLRTRDEDVIPVVEERLKVGKRPLARTVRVYTRVTERPVEEDVRLREERVRLERRPADRPVAATDEAFRDRSIRAQRRENRRRAGGRADMPFHGYPRRAAEPSADRTGLDLSSADAGHGPAQCQDHSRKPSHVYDGAVSRQHQPDDELGSGHSSHAR